ncbi:MAG: ABC transporter permease [Phaeodactylibacter sp.]|nr:ABC transporter permease [Phaeodactylibacter sp.]MCB9264172.1 ABC transporter permease [Lewinellaceae bacterium]MCB9286792.1 ABC transporter permease [Lewinellaceae bacterium]
MLHHYLTIVRRFFTREWGYSLINLSGLVLGLTAVLLAFTFIRDESQYDAFHDKAGRIFRVNKWVKEDSGERFLVAETPGMMAPTMVADYPEVEAATHYAPWFDEVLLTHENQSVNTEGFVFADTSFLQLFDFEMVRGDPSALAVPGQLLITPKLAAALFGDEDPLGKAVIGLDDNMYSIAGIIAAPPRRSHLQFEALASWSSTRPGSGFHDFSFMNNWLGQTVYTYVLLQDAGQEKALDAKFPAFVERYMANRTGRYDFFLQPLSEVYLHSDNIRYLRGNKYGSAVFMRTFSIIALLVLLVACFNYINISTAKSVERSKEVGVKKVLGAGRRALAFQFLTETFIFTGLAGMLSLALAHALLPRFNILFGRDIPSGLLSEYLAFGFLGLTVVVVSLTAGVFPALVLSGFRPIQVLKARKVQARGSAGPRAVLTALQLSLSVGLIAGAIVLYKQFNFILSKDLGFDKEQVLVMSTPPGIERKSELFRAELEQLPGVESVSICQAAIRSGTFGTTVLPEGSNGKEVPAQSYRVEENFLETFGIELAEGRFLSTQFPTDTSVGALVVNEQMVRQMGWEEPLGKTIKFTADGTAYPIVGVVKDFHFDTFQQPIGPLVMYLDGRKNHISVRFDRGELPALLPALSRLWESYEPRFPFNYYFLDEHFAKDYLAEQRMVKVVGLFSLLAIFIACLGLYGLASFTVSRRVREIGIRKVLGASVGQILMLLHHRLFYLTLVGFLMGGALSWYLLHSWLEQYAYAVRLSPWAFLMAGLLTLLVASLSVLSQSLRAALGNPADALRYE